METPKLKTHLTNIKKGTNEVYTEYSLIVVGTVSTTLFLGITVPHAKLFTLFLKSRLI